ncbi:Wadjet anti-phage system protein JetA family protein [Azospirillum argentinense]
MLFGGLPDDIFRSLTGKYRHAYAALLRRLHDGLFGLDTTRQPTRDDVSADIETFLESYVPGLAPEERDEFRLTPQLAYAELVETGWLREQRDGWSIHVDMDVEVAQLLGGLCALARPRSETFGGTVLSVVGTLDKATEDGAGNAQGVAEAAQRAREFARYARGVVGSLAEIEKTLLEQATLNGLVRTFFDEFVKRIVISDYRKLTSVRNHPYRHRYRILELVDRIGSDPALCATIADNLVAQGVADSVQDAQAKLDEDLRDIRLSMEAIETFRARIDRTKANIERRFENTLRYMDSLETGRAERFATGLAALARSVPHLGNDEPVVFETALFDTPSHIGGERLARPERPRPPVHKRRYAQPALDPLQQAFERAKLTFDRRMQLTRTQFMAYVRRKIEEAEAGGRDEVSARDIPPKDIEEFLVFSALRALPIARIPLPDGFEIEHRDGLVENDWLIARDFVLRRSLPTVRAED